MTTTLTNRVSQALSPLFSRDPFTSLQQEMEDVLSRFKTDWNGGSTLAVISPSVDLSETADSLQLRMDVPGIQAEEIDIQVSGDTVRISGEHKEDKEEKGKTFHRIERRCGSFARALTLPTAVKADQVTAECKDGVLTITLPKSEVAKTQKVKVLTK
ncbi:MAG: Hsp20/alpha crystallin family protein [Pirellulaceae bacterium]|nr:Hsp20/alpha crystallin family protein [Pirellulaceae bacterium]